MRRTESRPRRRSAGTLPAAAVALGLLAASAPALAQTPAVPGPQDPPPPFFPA